MLVYSPKTALQALRLTLIKSTSFLRSVLRLSLILALAMVTERLLTVFSMRKFIPPFVALLLVVSLFLFPINAFGADFSRYSWFTANYNGASYRSASSTYGYSSAIAYNGGVPVSSGSFRIATLEFFFSIDRTNTNGLSKPVIGETYFFKPDMALKVSNTLFSNNNSFFGDITIYTGLNASGQQLLFQALPANSMSENGGFFELPAFEYTLSSASSANYFYVVLNIVSNSNEMSSTTAFPFRILYNSPNAVLTKNIAGDGANWSGNNPIIPSDGSDEILGSISGGVDSIDNLLSNSNDFVSSLTSSFSFISSTINRFWTDSDLTPVVVLVLSLGLAFYVIGKRVSSS